MRQRHSRFPAIVAALGTLLLAACGAPAEAPTPEAAPPSPAAETVRADVSVVVTTSILGDLTERLVGDDGEVTVIVPPGVDPHGFQPSAAAAASLRRADLVIANGLQLEENLISALEGAREEGINVLEVAEHLDPIEFDGDASHDHGHGEDGHGQGDDGHDHGHGEDDHGQGDDGHGHGDDGDGHGHGDDDHGHAHGPEDPHVWLDPVRMADGVRLIAGALADVDDILEDAEWERRGEELADELLALHEELEAIFAELPRERRLLITNHHSLGYLAARYDFEVLGTVIPGATPQVEADARHFAELVRTVEETGVPAVFADNTDTARLAEQLATEVVGRSDIGVEVVRLYTHSVGEPGSGAETYFDLMRLNAERIVAALQ